MTPAQHLKSAIAKYSPEVAAMGRAVLKKMRARIPGAVEMVYDNYNGLVVGFSPTERPSDAVFSVILFPRWVTLCFLYGAFLDDPEKILKGSGSRVRNVRLASADDLDQPALRALVDQAVADAEGPMNLKSQRRLVIRAVQKKQRPRRPR
ncbi:MAG: DUF1801 domain-containing protein [Acidobacteria bacterium]|nr:DUF1801 domain-containing protein [Acidobacteriota bacterium]